MFYGPVKMWFASLLLGLAVAVAGEETTREPTVPATIEETLGKRRCVPTAVAIGPCHVCSCSFRGAYQCHTDTCTYEDKDYDKPPSSQPECEPLMLYNEGALWCLCNEIGFWNSTNCRANFRSMKHKFLAKEGPVFNKNIPCESGSLYVVDCNVCECRGLKLTSDACTNRTCAAGAKADQCKLGQLLRAGQQLCSCSEVGYYVDQLCINLPTNETIQKIQAQDIATLNAEKKAAPRTPCVPFSVIQRDCNRCTCMPNGSLVCTSMLCLSSADQADNGTVASAPVPLGRSRATRHELLPELKSDKDPCEAGKQYKYKCNTCYCTKKGLPACTTMICLDFFGSPKKDKESVRVLGNPNRDVFDLPEIQEGEECIEGMTYRLDCNVCRCSAKSRLVCTKKLCLSKKEMTKQLEFEKKMRMQQKKKRGKIYSTKNKNMYMEVFDDKVVIHQRTENKNIARSGPENSTLPANDKLDKEKNVDHNTKEERNKKDTKKQKKTVREENKTVKKENQSTSNEKSKENSKEKETSSETMRSSLYQPLPNTKCNPGQIYTKGCQRCFCNFKKIAQCTNRPCNEMTGPVTVPKDVYPRISPKEIANLPTLPHEAARCKPGKVYMVECNVCLCLSNGNLLCNSHLCLAMEEVNKLAALKQNGKPCKMKGGKLLEANIDCVECSCVQSKYRCSAVEKCIPFRFRRLLHGELSPKIQPKLSLDEKDAKCTPGMVYRQNCNNCYCQDDGSLRCTRKGCLNFQQVQKLKKQRQRLLKLGKDS